jgi:hypothetical protein
MHYLPTNPANYCCFLSNIYDLNPPGEGLCSKLDKDTQKTEAARQHLTQLHTMLNPNAKNGERYTNGFFMQQWAQEQEYHCETQASFRQKQKKELGCLL